MSDYIIYNEPLFRPPAESESLITQLTIGCSYNKCRFCAMYKTKKFYIKTENEFEKHVQYLKKKFPYKFKRVFIGDGDALTVNTQKLIQSIRIIKENFSDAKQFNIYGSVFSVKNKTYDELVSLKNIGLRIVYLGIESGNQETLNYMNKNINVKEMVEQCIKIKNSGLKLSVTVITGLGLKTDTVRHITDTADIINKIEPNYTSVLNMMTQYTEFDNMPEFQSYSYSDYCKELELLIKNINCRTVFRSNHNSNYIPLEGNLPKHKLKLLKILNL